VRTVAGRAPDRPWFAIGGIDEARLDDVLAAGARRVVVVRAITEAADPRAAATRLAERLDGVEVRAGASPHVIVGCRTGVGPGR